MTEADAKTKWCPFVRLHGLAGAVNRLSGAMLKSAANARARGNAADAEYIEQEQRDTFCIGSACMAWRWDRVSAGSFPTITLETSTTIGHCGLAGE